MAAYFPPIKIERNILIDAKLQDYYITTANDPSDTYCVTINQRQGTIKVEHVNIGKNNNLEKVDPKFDWYKTGLYNKTFNYSVIYLPYGYVSPEYFTSHQNDDDYDDDDDDDNDNNWPSDEKNPESFKNSIGNGILFKCLDSEYYYCVSQWVVKFKIPENDSFVDFSSVIGNNDVVQTSVIGRHFYYLLPDCIKIARNIVGDEHFDDDDVLTTAHNYFDCEIPHRERERLQRDAKFDAEIDFAPNYALYILLKKND